MIIIEVDGWALFNSNNNKILYIRHAHVPEEQPCKCIWRTDPAPDPMYKDWVISYCGICEEPIGAITLAKLLAWARAVK